jgi:exodeoxyribonuclease VII small subunit
MDKKTEAIMESSFEEASVKLEKIVKLLEDPSTPLDKALEYYSEGIELIKLCNKKLDEAEQKIKFLGEKDND